MQVDLMTLDPEQAWAPYEPQGKSDWSRRKVAHAFRRGGFGATPEEIEQGLSLSPAELAAQLVRGKPVDDRHQQGMEAIVQTALASNNADRLAATWLYRMLRTPHPLQEKMTLFWHGHFATSNEKVSNAALMHNQNTLLREHALGDFKQLAHGISRDPAMLLYLDSESNRKAHPNENFARELMELFILGEGHYTETDVRELARCFTGWELRRGRYRFNRYQHDRGSKTVLGETGEFGGENGVDIVLRQDQGPRFIVRKLVRFFVCDEPTFPDRLLEPLARELRENDWNVGPTMQTILASNVFFSKSSLGRKVRSPVELTVGLLRSLHGSANVDQLSVRLRQLGHGLFHPPNVKGWDGGRTWINSSTLLGRANLIRSLLGDESTRFQGGTLDGILKHYQVSPEDAVGWMDDLLLAVPLNDGVRAEVRDVVQSATGSADLRLRKALHALSLQPEFQLA